MRWPWTPAPLPPGHYRIATLADAIEVCRHLPEDRREVFLAEIPMVIRQAAAQFNFIEPFGLRVAKVGAITWIDDDAGVITTNALQRDGENILSFVASPAPTQKESK